jgi:GNAT superfamily N-acetyltransferase
MIEDLEIREGLDGLNPARITTLYRRAPLTRQADAPERVWLMFERSSLVLTAWHQGRLVGIARVLTDGVAVTYVCDVAVEPDVQGLGIGRSLVQGIVERCRGTRIMVRDDGTSRWYRRLGFRRVEDAWEFEGA